MKIILFTAQTYSYIHINPFVWIFFMNSVTFTSKNLQIITKQSS